ncbi:MAG: HTR-like protein, partial [Halobacteria archaeon]|nr:HTR-like protein [Halobacteria archaeon]
MSKSKRKTRELVDEDPELEDVLKTLLDVQEEKGEVEWSDVKTEATSGHWGRLIEKGLLVDSDDGFVFEDEKAVKQALGIETEDESEEDDGDVTVSPDVETPGDVDTGWSYLDK